MATEEQVRREVIESLKREADRVNVPWLYQWTSITHYYGDTVRKLLLAAAAIMLVGAPFYTDSLATEFPFIIVGTIVLVAVAAMTSPVKKSAIRADAVVSGVGLVIFEIWALLGYNVEELHKFALREALAFIFFFALYFSSKTLRAMLLNSIGRRETPEDLMERKHKALKPEVNWREEAQDVLEEINDRAKTRWDD